MDSREYNQEIARLAEWISDNRPAELGGEGFAAEYGVDAGEYFDGLHGPWTVTNGSSTPTRRGKSSYTVTTPTT